MFEWVNRGIKGSNSSDKPENPPGIGTQLRFGASLRGTIKSRKTMVLGSATPNKCHPNV